MPAGRKKLSSGGGSKCASTRLARCERACNLGGEGNAKLGRRNAYTLPPPPPPPPTFVHFGEKITIEKRGGVLLYSFSLIFSNQRLKVAELCYSFEKEVWARQSGKNYWKNFQECATSLFARDDFISKEEKRKIGIGKTEEERKLERKWSSRRG